MVQQINWKYFSYSLILNRSNKIVTY